MVQESLMLFDTALGRCGLAWGDRGIVAASFPEASDEKTRKRLRRTVPNAQEVNDAPDEINTVIDDIIALFEGEGRDLKNAVVNLSSVSDFERQVYEISRCIKPGEVRTYGELARELGDVSLSRQVGQALGRNPVPIIVPCHRIVGANGIMTGFSAPGGTDTKRKLLKIEGAIGPDLFDMM